MPKIPMSGFTLAELLIALAILGEIATFTIPKILSSQQNQSRNASAHEVASMISGAFQQYALNNQLATTATPANLTQYMNYTAVDVASVLDDIPTFNATFTCGGNVSCLKLHNGGTLFYQAAENFAGSNTTNAIHFWFDPDGVKAGTTADGPTKTVVFVIYYNGRVTSRAQVASGTVTSTYAMSPGATLDPSWFSW